MIDELEELRELAVASPRPFIIDLAKSTGMYLATMDGRMLFDWAGYYGSKLLAHNHECYSEPEFVSDLLLAATNKVANPDFVTPYLLRYVKALHEIAPRCLRNPAMKVYTVNSGAEAVENGLKYLITRYFERGKKGKPQFITFKGGFHGRTVYALNHTDMPHSPSTTKDYHGLTTRPITIEWPEWNEDEPAATNSRREEDVLRTLWLNLHNYMNMHNIAGIVVEPMQGAGGHRCASSHFFRRLDEIAADHDVPIMFDEVQTGGGACGDFWMCDTFGSFKNGPEVVVSAKKLACGVVYMRNALQADGLLDNTWSGHLADMVRFVQELKVVKESRLIEKACFTGEALKQGLLAIQSELGAISNVRGQGLYLGFSVPSREIRDGIVRRLLVNEQTLVLNAGVNSIRVRPNLNVTEQDADLFIQKLRRVL